MSAASSRVRLRKPVQSAQYISEKALTKEDDLESVVNIRKTTADKLRKIGINTAEFLKKDPYEVFYELLKKVDSTLCRCALASIVGAKNGKKWYTVTKEAAKEYEKSHQVYKWGKC